MITSIVFITTGICGLFSEVKTLLYKDEEESKLSNVLSFCWFIYALMLMLWFKGTYFSYGGMTMLGLNLLHYLFKKQWNKYWLLNTIDSLICMMIIMSTMVWYIMAVINIMLN